MWSAEKRAEGLEYMYPKSRVHIPDVLSATGSNPFRPSRRLLATNLPLFPRRQVMGAAQPLGGRTHTIVIIDNEHGSFIGGSHAETVVLIGSVK